MKNDKCSIIVSSFDGSNDLWDPFFKLFFKYWSDAPYKVYLINSKIKYDDSRVVNCFIEDKDWSTNLIEAIKKTNTDYIVYLQEDYFFTSKVNTIEIEKMIDMMKPLNIGYIRLVPSPEPDLPFSSNKNLGIISKGSQYRTSLQGAIWEKETLINILKGGESGWDMEKYGSQRSNNLNKLFLSVNNEEYNVLPYYRRTAIKKGKWMPGALRLCKREGIIIKNSKRKVHSDISLFFGDIRRCVSKYKGKIFGKNGK